MTRLKFNLEILTELKVLAEQNPELRFVQLMSVLLVDTPLKDLWYEESYTTLFKIKKLIKRE